MDAVDRVVPILAYLTRRYLVGVPAADVTAAFWVLSLYFQERGP